jgi:hypothetical protein
MFGLRFYKAEPTTYVLRYSRGRVVQEGPGLSFFYFAPTTSLAAVPLASSEVPFILELVSLDFQRLTVQGHVSYRIARPREAAELLDFTLDPATGVHRAEDGEKLKERVVNKVAVLLQEEVGRLDLRAALGGAPALVDALSERLKRDAEVSALGLSVLTLAIAAVRPVPDTARALEAGAREAILKAADEAIYARRNAAVAEERAIKENELATEIAVEQKRREIREAQMDAEAAVRAKQHEMGRADMEARIGIETRNTELVARASANARTEAEARAHGMSALMQAFAAADPRVVQALSVAGMQPGQMLAMAFQGLAEKADKIGQLNVSPDLLRELLNREE